MCFNSAAKLRGTSLNDVLVTCLDLNDSLLSVLVRFRKNKVSILADTHLTFSSSEVHKEQKLSSVSVGQRRCWELGASRLSHG